MARRNVLDPAPAAFVDTAAWVGLVDRSDSLHGPARRVLATLDREKAVLVTTELVRIEVANSLAIPAFRIRVAGFIQGLRDNPQVRILSAEPVLLADAWKLFGERPDKAWSLTDCFSFVVMGRESIARAFTSDHHFEQAGFVRLLSPA